EHLRPDRDVQLGHDACGAVLQCAAAAAAATRLDVLMRAERRQIAKAVVRDENNVATGAAVAAVRPSFRDVLLPAEGEAAVAAAARLNMESNAVVEHHQRPSRAIPP